MSIGKRQHGVMTGGEAVVASLVANGARLAFGIPGMHNLAIYDALVDRPEFRHIVTRNEQGASLMANGAGRLTGEPGICLVTTGPGACNALVGVADAARESVPMLVIASQITSHLIGLGKGAFHEVHDQAGMFAAAGAWVGRPQRVEDIPAVLNAAWVAMTHGRPGPAYVEIPQDVLFSQGEATIAAAAPPPRPAPGQDVISDILAELLRAERPLILAGAGAVRSRAGQELRTLVESLGIPLVTTIHGKGLLPEDHPQSGGVLPLKEPTCARVFDEVDLLLALGTGFGEVTAGGWLKRFPQNLIHVDIDGAQIGRNVPPSTGIVADARSFLVSLNEMVGQEGAAARTGWEAWCRRVASLPGRLRKAAQDMPGAEISRVMRSLLPRDAVIVGDAAQWGGWQIYHLPMYEAPGMLYPIHFGTLGYSVPGAIGAKAASPGQTVVAVCGDGGFLFCSQELVTAVQHQLPVIVVLVNNSCYGTIRFLQERQYGAGRVIASHLDNPDFVTYATSLGCFARRVEDVSGFEAAFDEALASGKPALLELPFCVDPSPGDYDLGGECDLE